MALRVLTEHVNELSTKRFVRSRPARIERWLQIEAVANETVRGLQALARVVKRARPAPAVVNEPPAEQAAAS